RRPAPPATSPATPATTPASSINDKYPEIQAQATSHRIKNQIPGKNGNNSGNPPATSPPSIGNPLAKP
ncbi:MAG TPA: hypothetical protein VF510_04695, partial [Ktedonobacterales bacterium]